MRGSPAKISNAGALRYITFGASFAIWQPETLPLEIDVLPFQFEDLATPPTGQQQELDRGGGIGITSAIRFGV